INQHAGDRDVEPYGICEAGDASVSVIAGAESTGERDQDHRHDRRGENGVRGEQRKINRADDALGFERRDETEMEMVVEVGGEKDRRGAYGGDHEVAMGVYAFGL